MASKSKIIDGLEQAVRFAHGEKTLGTIHRVLIPAPPDVRIIREKQSLTQKEFAEKYGFSLATLRNWEQGHRVPTGASRVLLLVIAKSPETVEAALAA